MKKFCLLSLAILSILCLDGCKKMLNETAYSFLTPINYPTNQPEAVTALNGAYNVMQQTNSYRYVLTYYLCTADDQSHPSSPGVLTSDAGRWMTAQINSAFTPVLNFWRSYWQGVNACNAIIQSVGKLNQPWGPSIIAEARALRAFYYFNLIRLWGDVPIKQDPTDQPVVSLPRSPASDVYLFIIDDLKYAESNLNNDIGNGGGRFTTGAVKALLAEVYMTFAGYRRTPAGQLIQGDASYFALARDKAKEVLDREVSGLYVLSPDYSQIFKDLSSDVYNKEIIWDVEFVSSGNASNFPGFFGAAGGAVATLGSGNDGANYNKEYIATYNVNDTRYVWDVANYKYTSASPWTKVPLTDPNSFGMAKYQKIPQTTYSSAFPTNFPLIRLADIKLLYAEAINEANGGPNTVAYQQINAVRYRARPTAHKTDGTVLPDLSGLSQSQFRDAIMQERGWELTVEGIRRFDLIRWGLYVEKVKAQASQAVSTTIQPANYLLPIPKGEMDLNPTWKQNDGF